MLRIIETDISLRPFRALWRKLIYIGLRPMLVLLPLWGFITKKEYFATNTERKKFKPNGLQTIAMATHQPATAIAFAKLQRSKVKLLRTR